MLFVGGAGSLVTTLVLFSILPVSDPGYLGSIVVGVVEEIGKLVIITYFVYKLNTKYILNGYLLVPLLELGLLLLNQQVMHCSLEWQQEKTQWFRLSLCAAGWPIGTLFWAAITVAALVYVKRETSLNRDHFFNKKFLQLFAVPILLHALWPIEILEHFYLKYFLLIVIVWVFIKQFYSNRSDKISILRDGSLIL